MDGQHNWKCETMAAKIRLIRVTRGDVDFGHDGGGLDKIALTPFS